ncbi:nitroreductase family protein [Methanospirillum sp. J.3.6.1-F.2.7.3]|uniref:Nitroreductase family protein n=1 Tax=Methanospirillum purgamenti TaxID=2834276 RepID=A0A8E7B2N6_9EURY|nr:MULTISPECIES: nitroreductase family protein [Methanospirillum]MDX8550631.1 nitroreductase family protein [Methanospirillum hungatei]NLW77322.1 nitroreductase [Methanomicrobiales archaeon]QVV89784.1 nitroreductase family protein [Methanospirillum sp. J.3.6.1-F.2.7.3]
MNLSELSRFLAGRTSVRHYLSDQVPDNIIKEILSSTRSAPSAGNLESWDVIVVTDEGTRELLADAAFNQEHVSAAPVVFVVCANYVRSMSRYGERGILYAMQDATIAGTYLMMAIHASGLGSCWTGAFDDEMVRETLDLPGHIRPVTLLTAGYTKEVNPSPHRMETAEHVHFGYW